MNIESTNVGGTIVCVGIVEHYAAVNIEIWQNHASHTRRIARNPYTNGIDDEKPSLLRDGACIAVAASSETH